MPQTTGSRSSRAATADRGRKRRARAAGSKRSARADDCAVLPTTLRSNASLPGPAETNSGARQLARHAAIRIGERALRVLAAEHRALDLRPERFLDAAVVAEAPIAGHLVGVLELRLQHFVDCRIVFGELGERRLVDGNVAGHEL